MQARPGSSSPPDRRASLSGAAAQVFPGLIGLWIGLALIKFGNPVILDHQIEMPQSGLETLLQPWPIAWGYAFFAVVVLCGISSWHQHRSLPLLLVALPALWLGWQCLSAAGSIRPSLTRATMPHFFVCVACYYLGHFALSRLHRLQSFWLAVIGSWLVVTAIGWRQHFGGLAEMREFFYSLPDWREQPPELIAKVASNRIYSTLVYPNALAGVILLFTPVVVMGAWDVFKTRPLWMRIGAVATPLAAAIGCLFWSGSKSGWLIGLGLAALGCVFRSGKGTRPIWLLVLLAFILGLSAFWVQHRDYFSRGATSVTSRFDYWKEAAANAVDRPVMGSGPGTFMEVYRRVKPAHAEMTRLAHNDYLQQFSDSGVLGGALYLAIVGTSWWVGFRSRKKMSPIWFGVWLGITGFAVQSLTEFGLYIPALAWPWFLGLGSLAGAAGNLKTVDKVPASS